MESQEFFRSRHIGPRGVDREDMLRELGLSSAEALISKVVPPSIRMDRPLRLPPALSEREALVEVRGLSSLNRVFRSFLGTGYSGTFVPPVIQRNVLENPGWYTQYTPYQPEISQGRLEALLNFQTMIADLTGFPVANASLLDEATAAAEAMALCRAVSTKTGANRFLVSSTCHPQTIQVVRGRAEPLGIEVLVAEPESWAHGPEVFACLIQVPDTKGKIKIPETVIAAAKAGGTLVIASCDLLSLLLVRPPGEWGADVAIGSSQRFGVPLGFGGPHAAFLATRDAYKRQIPGRIVGVSKDAAGKVGYRLALQTREQHIRREKATSNICTAQVLLAVMASFYAVYHGPEGLRAIAERTHRLAALLAQRLRALGFDAPEVDFFDTVAFHVKTESERDGFLRAAEKLGMLLRPLGKDALSISLDELSGIRDVADLLSVFGGRDDTASLEAEFKKTTLSLSSSVLRSSAVLSHPVFHRHRSETEMLRYIRKLESRDLSLTRAMIPLGSCTMKLNATSEMFPVSEAGFASIHPHAPDEHVAGYRKLFSDLEEWIAEITGFDAVSLQPNAGSQGEYAGLLAIRKYHRERGDFSRDVCLIPRSAHGTNPASAVMAGFRVVVVECDADGNVDLEDLRKKALEYATSLGALMVTYPSTHGVFEEGIREICEIVHGHGGQVYMDGANLNAQVGLCRPGDFGPDVCHLNLHKTFCIPHGGGGPGMGPIAVKTHLAPYLPGKGPHSILPVSAASHGSASILPISWMYIRMMGPDGLREATEVAILSANYLASKLGPHYPVLYRGKNGLVAHECILDLRPLKAVTGIEVEDVAKRLMDYGFHAPTISFPVAGTLMIEPTESEPKEELDRFVEAMIAIRGEIREIEEGKADRARNLLKGAPHTADAACAEAWDRPYSRERAVFPLAWVRENKFWPTVARIDHAYGDRNLVCSCPPL